MYIVCCSACGHKGVVALVMGKRLTCTACGVTALPRQGKRILPTRNATTNKQTENQNDNAQAL